MPGLFCIRNRLQQRYTYIEAPNIKPIVNVIDDIPKVPGLQKVVDKGSFIDMYFTVNQLRKNLLTYKN